MGAPIRFLFDNDFATPPPDVVEVREEDLEEEVPKIELEVHLEELRNAEAAAYERGLQDGLRSVEAESHQHVAQEARRLADAADKMITMVDGDLRRIETEATVLCLAIAKKISGFALGNYPHCQIMTLVEECLAPLRDVRHLAIRVNEMDVEKLKQPIESLAAKSGFEGRLLILGEPETQPGDCRIEWADGGVVFERNAILATVDAAIRTYLGPAGDEYDLASMLDESDAVDSVQGDIEALSAPGIVKENTPDDVVSDDGVVEGQLAADTNVAGTGSGGGADDLENGEAGLAETDSDELIVEAAGEDDPDREAALAEDPANAGPDAAGMSDTGWPETYGPETDGPETYGPETDGPAADGPAVDGPLADAPATDGTTSDEVEADIVADAAPEEGAGPENSDPAVSAGDVAMRGDQNEDDLTLEERGIEDVDQVDMGAEQARPGDTSNE